MTATQTLTSRRTFGASALFLVACVACGGSAESAHSAADRAAERLQGRWILAEWVPAQPLDPVLGTLLGAQIGQMVITIDHRNLNAGGVGIAAQRAYRITEAEGDRFAAVIVEGATIEYTVSGTFQGQELHFSSQTAPWVGRGRLVRAR